MAGGGTRATPWESAIRTAPPEGGVVAVPEVRPFSQPLF